MLSLVRRSDATVVELGRVPGELTPCDSDGWTCDAHADDDVRCTEAEMRAERRLCVQPRSIDRVARSDDGTSLLVIGTRIVAGERARRRVVRAHGSWEVRARPLPPDCARELLAPLGPMRSFHAS